MDVFHALAEPTRRDIIQLLATNGQLSVTDICDNFPVTPPAISQHLKVLREADLVAVRKQGQQRLYYMNADGMMEVEQWAKKTRQLWVQRFGALDKLLQVEKKN